MRRLGWLVAGVALAAACSKKAEAPPPVQDAGPAQLTEREPNDRLEQAQPLPASSVVTGSLAADPAHPDEDWYGLSSTTPRVADVTVSGIPGVALGLELYDTDRNRLEAIAGTGPGQPIHLPDLGVRGPLFLRVFSRTRGSGGAYTLTVLYSDPSPGFEWEPNDRAADATLLRAGEIAPNAWQASGFISHPDDQDWYQIELSPDGGAAAQVAPPSDASTAQAAPPAPPGPAAAPAPGQAGGAVPPAPQAAPAAAPGGGADGGALASGADGGLAPSEPREALRIELSAVPGVKPEIQVLSAAQAPLFSASGKESEPLSLRNVGVRAADHVIYVLVKSGWSGTGKEAKRGSNDTKPYTLTVTREAAGLNAELEPNDDPEHATPLPTDGYREGFISTKGDVDYYVLRPPGPSIVNVQLSGVEHADLVLSAVQPATAAGQREVVLKSANDGAVKEPEYLNDIACSGACFFRVEGALKKENGKWVKSYANPDEPYRISVTATPETGAVEREPNDTAETATPLTLGKPIRGTVQPKKDDDFYKLDLSDRAVKTPIQATVTGILKVDIGLYLWKVTGGGKELVQTSDRGRGDAPRVVRYAADPGVYLVEVRDTKNRESNFQDYYQLTVEEAQ